MTATVDESNTFPVLLVEDNRGDARLVLELLKEVDNGKFEVSHVERLAEARQQLMEGARASTSRSPTPPGWRP